MARIVTIAGSPSATSRTSALVTHLGQRLRTRGHHVTDLAVRDLPAEALLGARFDDPQIAEATTLITRADALVIGTPVYKASYSGLLKALLDLLPQRALAGTSVLPIATGGTVAHLLALDYALRPVLGTLGASQIAQGWFVLDSDIAVADDGRVTVSGETGGRSDQVLAEFAETLGTPVPALAFSA